MSEFFEMGGHGAYIWPAYLIAAAVMIGLLVASVISLKKKQHMLETLQKVAKAENPAGSEEKAA